MNNVYLRLVLSILALIQICAINCFAQTLPDTCESINQPTVLQVSSSEDFNKIIINYATYDLAQSHSKTIGYVQNRGDARLSRILSFVSHSVRPTLEVLDNDNFIKLLKLRQNLKRTRTELINAVSAAYAIDAENFLSLNMQEVSCTVCAHYSCSLDPDDVNCIDINRSNVNKGAIETLDSFYNLLRRGLALSISVRDLERSKLKQLLSLLKSWKKDLVSELQSLPSELSMSFDCR